MNLIKFASLTLVSSLLLGACSSQPEQQTEKAADPYPDWFYKPNIENGLAAASCVPIPGSNVSVAQKQATANGRANLAFQIEAKVKAMDKTYDRVTTTNQGSSTGGTFESVSKQVTEQSLAGSRTEKFERVIDDGKKMMCALVTLNPTATNDLFQNLIQSAEVNLAPDHEAVLKEQFMAYKAQQELEQELMK